IFFFQAEDGIRDFHVTGVQTCALPIWGVSGVATPSTLGALPEALARALRDERPSLRDRCLTRLLRQDHVWCDRDAPDRNGLLGRSEERRAGNEWRARGAR